VGLNGSAVVKAHGIIICTAKITNGKGSCGGVVNGTGTITFTADFTGTMAGIAGTATVANNAGNWKFATRIYYPQATVWATDTRSTGAKLTLRVAVKKYQAIPTIPGC